MLRKNNNYKLGDKTLDKYQTKAVKENANSYLVVAGAGSGKTLTIVAKVDYLIKEKKVDPKKILCLSFTNETVNTLKKSLEKYHDLVDVKTFHKLSLSILPTKKKIANSTLLEYIVEEYFYSYLYFDQTSKLLEWYLENHNETMEKFLKKFQRVSLSFIQRLKNFPNHFSFFLKIIFECKDKAEQILLIIIFKIYLLYEEELSSQGLMDFDDMIHMATEQVEKIEYFPYRYIIIDEYQDTSFSKYELIKKLIDKFSLSLMAVGDDYQSIYSFTGCDLTFFLQFKKLFPKSSLIKLKNTYRNPKDIVEISQRFVRKNKKQIRKRLHTTHDEKYPITIVYTNHIQEDFIKITESLDHILVLGRNNQDQYLLVDNIHFIKEENRIIDCHHQEKDIRFLTVHSAKGLEEDYVIVLNVVDDPLGFPNQIKEYELLKYVAIKKENYPYAEERRLFYVALTRARKCVFLFTNRENPSIFIQELLKDYRLKLKIIEFPSVI